MDARQLVAWQNARTKNFHPVAFGEAATADGRSGVYLAADVAGDRVSIRHYGTIPIHGVPFSLPDPAGIKNGANVIVLKGGAVPNAVSQTTPQLVELPVNQPAGRLHLLGAVAGWGWPFTKDRELAVAITIHYRGGESERIELVNAVDIADHAGANEVPGSARTSLVTRGQMRYLWRDIQHPGGESGC